MQNSSTLNNIRPQRSVTPKSHAHLIEGLAFDAVVVVLAGWFLGGLYAEDIFRQPDVR